MEGLKEVVIYDELDISIIEFDSQTTPVKELESFSMDSLNRTKSLQVKINLSKEAKEELKSFLEIWRHG